MTIDIIEYSELQYAALSSEKLEKIRAAQLKKDKLLQTLAARLKEEKQRLIDGGIFPSTMYAALETELTAACQAEIEEVREGLLFYLHYATNDGASGESTSPSDVPYTVDYSFTVEERLAVVRGYYETTYPDAAARFNAFKEDAFAKSYLGELYAPLYYRFQSDM